VDLGSLRQSYETAGIRIEDLDPDPLIQFEVWFRQVMDADYWEPNAMSVSTIGADGRPRSRNVLLKVFDDRGFVFYTNYRSHKGQELDANPGVALLFSWHELRRQVRIVGAAERTSAAESDAYFASRPRGSQIGAWTSPQSQPLASREELEAREAEVQAQFATGDVPRPSHWGGFLIRPQSLEFWQGRPNRLHDRIRYTRADQTGAWGRERLAP